MGSERCRIRSAKNMTVPLSSDTTTRSLPVKSFSICRVSLAMRRASCFSEIRMRSTSLRQRTGTIKCCWRRGMDQAGRLVNAFDDLFFHGAKRSDVGHAIPGVGRARLAAHGFIALEKARHEKFPGQRRQFDAAPLAIILELRGVVWINDAHHGAGLGRGISYGKIVF